MQSSTSQVEFLFQQQQQFPKPANDYCSFGEDAIRAELGAYGEQLLGSSSAYVRTNIIKRYLSNPRYYFQVNDEYVKKKIMIVLLPFLYKGNWFRACEKSAGNGEMQYKTPIEDINAPDLYIPVMAFGTYLVLSGFLLGINGKFSPEAMGVQFWNGILYWLLEIVLLEATLRTLGDGDQAPPLLDVVAYGGYPFATASVAAAARILFCDIPSFRTAAVAWGSFCAGVLLVKIVKRVLISEMRRCNKHSSKGHYFLLFVAVAQFPLLWLLGAGG